MKTQRPLIRDKHPAEWSDLLAETGHAGYRGSQLAEWLFVQGATRWDAMSNLPGVLRDELAGSYDLCGLELLERPVSGDGTRKFLFRLRDGQLIESVIIPMDGYATFCISSQVGCAMACRFCATARGGLARNLTAGEILEQVLRLRADLATDPIPDHGARQFNVVFMGMGEPLDNLPTVTAAVESMVAPQGLAMSPRRIQISTSGPAAGLEQLLDFAHPVGLTLSLGGSTDAERKRVMPVPGRTTLSEATRLAAEWAHRAKRRVTLAYVLIAGISDDLDQARRIADLARNRPFKVNLIPLNRLDEGDLEPTELDRVVAFQKVLVDEGVPAYVRLSGGQDIAAACGQLRRRRLQRGSAENPKGSVRRAR